MAGIKSYILSSSKSFSPQSWFDCSCSYAILHQEQREMDHETLSSGNHLLSFLVGIIAKLFFEELGALSQNICIF